MRHDAMNNNRSSSISQPRAAWPTNALDDCSHIEREASSLRYLAESFEHVGNEIVAERLREIALELNHRSKQIRDDIGNAVNQRFKDSMESSGNILAAVMAGSMIAKQDRDPEGNRAIT